MHFEYFSIHLWQRRMNSVARKDRDIGNLEALTDMRRDRRDISGQANVQDLALRLLVRETSQIRLY